MRTIITLFLLSLLLSCQPEVKESTTESGTDNAPEVEKIKVLNFATFHMGSTTDAHSVEFDEEDQKNQADAKQIAALITQFQPTVICVEVPPEYDQELNQEYQKYLASPQQASSYYGEVGLVAFEVGRLNKIDRIYGIDHKLAYNYSINDELENKIDPATFNELAEDPFRLLPDLNIFEEGLSLEERLRRINHPDLLDLLIEANADILAFVGSEGGFEGADEAAKYYQRNLRIYSNLNRIPLTKQDRVFILAGGSHTAFLNEFMGRSSKYEVVNTMDYLD